MRIMMLLAAASTMSVHSAASAQDDAASGTDIFGVYAPPIFDGGLPPRSEPDEIPFTAAGRRRAEAYVPARDNPRVLEDCVPETMPRILWTGNPIEIVAKDGVIEFHYERANTVRSIDMSGRPAPAEQPASDLGYSAGSWVEDVLTIETTHMSGGTITDGDRPLSAEGRVTERYWREPGENDLQLELEIDDPVNYTARFTMAREFIWAPDEQVRTWECISLGPKDTPPDIDELARMLEGL